MGRERKQLSGKGRKRKRHRQNTVQQQGERAMNYVLLPPPLSWAGAAAELTDAMKVYNLRPRHVQITDS